MDWSKQLPPTPMELFKDSPNLVPKEFTGTFIEKADLPDDMISGIRDSALEMLPKPKDAANLGKSMLTQTADEKLKTIAVLAGPPLAVLSITVGIIGIALIVSGGAAKPPI